ncbi:MAG: oligosaccharide flippase family protein [Pseudomonadota bacterium]
MSLAKKTIFSSFILLSLSFIQRSIGLISILILARTLTPDDFGIVAIVTLIVCLFNSLSSGSMKYIIQKKSPTNNDLNSAWTINIILKFSVFVLFVLFIPSITEYYNNEKLLVPLYFASLMLPISALGNPGIYLLRKDLNFKPIFKLQLITKLVTTSLMIFLALYYKSYWAMIIGIVLTELILTFGSYLIHTYKPKLSFCNIKEQWGFSQWVFLKSIVGYTREQIDSFIIAKYFDASSIGAYSLMKNLSRLPANQIIEPATIPLLSSFAKSKGNIAILNYRFKISFLIIIILIAPISSFMFYFDTHIISVLLGEKWLSYSKIFGIFSVSLAILSLTNIMNSYITAIGQVKILFIADFLSAIITVSVMFYYRDTSIEFIALLKVCTSFVIQFILFAYLNIAHSVPFRFVINSTIYYIGASYLIGFFVKTYILYSVNSIFFETLIYFFIFCLLYLLIFIISLSFKKKYPEIEYIYNLLQSGIVLLRQKLFYSH